MTSTDVDLRARREKFVLEHRESENTHDIDVSAFFLFEDDRLVCERVSQNMATILTQLGLGAADIA